MNETLERRSSALGMISIATAFAAIGVLVLCAHNSGIWIRGRTVYVVGPYPYSTHNNETLGYIGISLCLLGVAIGIEGFRRPTSQKLFAIVGALMNVTVLLSAAAVFAMYVYWFS